MVAPPSLLGPLHIPTQKWSEVSMDFITVLPTSKGKDSIFVIIDRLTKYAHFISISSKSKASQVAYSYVKSIFKFHGFPKVFVSDRDPKFTNNFWKELFHRNILDPPTDEEDATIPLSIRETSPMNIHT